MVPLALAPVGQISTVKTVEGKSDVVGFLESLGFHSGARVSPIAKQGGNVIVKVKDARVAISSEMAGKIMV